MPSLEYFVVAESVSVDQDTNRTSIFNVLEEVATTKFPLAIPNVAAIALWNADAGDYDKDWQATLRLHLPGDEKVGEFSLNFKFLKESKRHRLTFRFMGIPVKEKGDIRFELLLNGNPTAHHLTFVREPNEAELETITKATTVP